MKTVFSSLCARRSGQMELVTGAIVPGFKKTSRAEIIKARVASVKLGRSVHPTNTASRRQIKCMQRTSSTPANGVAEVEGAGQGRRCRSPGRRGACALCGRKAWTTLPGFYSFDARPNFVEGTWTAIKSSFDVALTGPGGSNQANGPPLRSAARRGIMPAAPSWAAMAPATLVVSLGVDTFEKDPIGQFKLKSEDSRRSGGASQNSLLTLFVMEGGYAVDEIGGRRAD